jgi:hypothetical protein
MNVFAAKPCNWKHILISYHFEKFSQQKLVLRCDKLLGLPQSLSPYSYVGVQSRAYASERAESTTWPQYLLQVHHQVAIETVHLYNLG